MGLVVVCCDVADCVVEDGTEDGVWVVVVVTACGICVVVVVVEAVTVEIGVVPEIGDCVADAVEHLEFFTALG